MIKVHQTPIFFSVFFQINFRTVQNASSKQIFDLVKFPIFWDFLKLPKFSFTCEQERPCASMSCDVNSRVHLLSNLCHGERQRVNESSEWFLRGEASPEQQMSSSE